MHKQVWGVAVTGLLTAVLVCGSAYVENTIDVFPCEFSMMGLHGSARVFFGVGLCAVAFQLCVIHSEYEETVRERLTGCAATIFLGFLSVFNALDGTAFTVHVISALLCFSLYAGYLHMSPFLSRRTKWLVVILAVLRAMVSTSFKAWNAALIYHKTQSGMHVSLTEWIKIVLDDPSMKTVTRWTSPVQWLFIVVLFVVLCRHLDARIQKKSSFKPPASGPSKFTN